MPQFVVRVVLNWEFEVLWTLLLYRCCYVCSHLGLGCDVLVQTDSIKKGVFFISDLLTVPYRID